jgi:hypothetical protein
MQEIIGGARFWPRIDRRFVEERRIIAMHGYNCRQQREECGPLACRSASTHFGSSHR